MKFRVLSDLHVDYNERYPLEIPESGRNVFAVLCGDTSGSPESTIAWIKANVRRGVLVSGNHLPYCNGFDLPPGEKRTMDELRRELAAAFPADSGVTYLDAETGTVKKVVDGVMFLGSCCYTDMRISHEHWNPDGDPIINRMCSEFNMNDYKRGFVGRRNGPGGKAELEPMTAKNYEKWFANAMSAFDKALSENEASGDPLPVVLVTHHPIIPNFLTHSGYVEDCNNIWSTREFNWASYSSDWRAWLRSHPSVKCYCCGHVHDVEKEWRHFDMACGNGRSILVVNNARGYVDFCHDYHFNPNLFVDTDGWKIVEEPLAEEETARRKAMTERLLKCSAWFM